MKEINGVINESAKALPAETYAAKEVVEEYLKAVYLLTVNEESRLSKRVNELTEKNRVFCNLRRMVIVPTSTIVIYWHPCQKILKEQNDK
jgi:hypothetical protein